MLSNHNYYRERVNKALKYLNSNLEHQVNVEALARESGFSLFHFQRVFKALQGESPYESLLRLRLEKSIFLLKYEQALKISEIASQIGFSSNENFSRQFKSRFKVSPSQFRKNKNLHNSRIYQEFSNNDFYSCYEKSRLDEKNSPTASRFEVKIEELERIPISYIRGVFGEDGSVLVDNYLYLIKWAKENEINW